MCGMRCAFCLLATILTNAAGGNPETSDLHVPRLGFAILVAAVQGIAACAHTARPSHSAGSLRRCQALFADVFLLVEM